MGKNRRAPTSNPTRHPSNPTRHPGIPTRYPKGKQPAGRRSMPQRSAGQQARLWLLSLCGAVPGAVVVYLTRNFWAGAGVFLAVVIVLGFALFLYEKRRQQ